MEGRSREPNKECEFCGEQYTWDEETGTWQPQCTCLDGGDYDEDTEVL